MDGSAWRGIAETCRRLSSPAERERTRRFVLEGYRLHERAVRAGAPPETILVAGDAMDEPSPRLARLMEDLAGAGSRMVAAPPDVVAELTGGRGSGPLVGIAGMPAPSGLKSITGACFLVAADVEDPGNVGAMIRTSLAAGCAGFIAAGISDPYHPKAVRTSMGSLFRIPIYRFDDSVAALSGLQGAGIRCAGAVSRGGAPLPAADLNAGEECVAMFLGGEARGLPAALLESLDQTVTIPMSERADSFSVNAAAAILLYELMRDRG